MDINLSEWERVVNQFTQANWCMYARTEGPHRVACRREAIEQSKDGLPACGEHLEYRLRDRWKGFIEGA